MRPFDGIVDRIAVEALRGSVQGRRRLAIPIQDACVAQSQPETITGPASSLPLVGVSLMTVVFLLGYFLRRRFQQLKPRDSFGFLPNSQRNSLSAPELTV